MLLTSLVSDGMTIGFRHASQNRQINAISLDAMNQLRKLNFPRARKRPTYVIEKNMFLLNVLQKKRNLMSKIRPDSVGR